MNDPFPRDEFGLEPHDAFADVVPYFHRERDDQQAARELAEEREQRAVALLRLIYANARSRLLDVPLQDVCWLAGELGLDWRDIQQ